MMTNGWRGAEECAAAERKVRDDDAVAMNERWEAEERTAVEWRSRDEEEAMRTQQRQEEER